MPKRTIKGEGKKYPLNMRTTQGLRTKLESAAAISGRSLAQEVELRLELSFAKEELIERARVESMKEFARIFWDGAIASGLRDPGTLPQILRDN